MSCKHIYTLVLLLAGACAHAQQHDCRTMRASELDGYDGPVKQVTIRSYKARQGGDHWSSDTTKGIGAIVTLYDKKGWMTKQTSYPLPYSGSSLVITAQPPVKGRIEMTEREVDDKTGDAGTVKITTTWLNDHSYEGTRREQIAAKGPDVKATCHQVTSLDKGCRITHIDDGCSDETGIQADYAYRSADSSYITYSRGKTVFRMIEYIVLSRDAHGNKLQVLVKEDKRYSLEEYSYEYY